MSAYGADHTIYLYANDTFGNEDISPRSVSIDAIELSQSYLNSTTEGSVSTFQINLTISSARAIATKDLIYNGSSRGAGTSSITGNNYSIIKSIEIPEIAVNSNITFYWNFSLDDGTVFKSSKANQTVSAFGVDNCDTKGTLVLNYSLKDEETQLLAGYRDKKNDSFQP